MYWTTLWVSWGSNLFPRINRFLEITQYTEFYDSSNFRATEISDTSNFKINIFRLTFNFLLLPLKLIFTLNSFQIFWEFLKNSWPYYIFAFFCNDILVKSKTYIYTRLSLSIWPILLFPALIYKNLYWLTFSMEH